MTMTTTPAGSARDYFECQCTDPAHTFIVELDTGDADVLDEPTLMVMFQLNTGTTFFTRVGRAFKYVFRIGDPAWGDVLIKHEDAQKISTIVSSYMALYKLRALRREKAKQRTT